MLSKVTLPSGSYIEFDYDGKGMRTYKYNSQTAAKTYFEYDDAWNLIAETDANNNILAYYTYDAAGRPISMYQPASNKTYYFHFNAHGDCVALTDATRKIVATYSYDPWGRVNSEWYDGGVVIKNPFRYGAAFGYYYDTETGLYYLKARYYKPDIYRFISKDPVQGDLSDPMSLNLYAYCADNPVKYVDPDGRIKIGLGFGSYFEIWFKGWSGLFKKYGIRLYLTAGGLALLLAGGVFSWQASVVKGAAAMLGVTGREAASIAIGFFLRAYIFKKGVTSLSRLSKSTGAYNKIYDLQTTIYVMSLV